MLVSKSFVNDYIFVAQIMNLRSDTLDTVLTLQCINFFLQVSFGCSSGDWQDGLSAVQPSVSAYLNGDRQPFITALRRLVDGLKSKRDDAERVMIHMAAIATLDGTMSQDEDSLYTKLGHALGFSNSENIAMWVKGLGVSAWIRGMTKSEN